jgi:ABC transporter substrate binding protein (PQQ-dependent alcohol dehydrogenase system)
LACVLGAGMAMTIATLPLHAQAPPRTLPIVYVEVEDDPRYEPVKAGERIVLRAPHRPYHGAAVAIDDAAALSRVTGVTLRLERATAEPGKAAEAIAEARRKHGASVLLLDLPPAAFAGVAAALKGQDVVAFNVSAPEDGLRRSLCAREIVHTLPSQAMRMDALVQYLVSRKWREILVLEGPQPEDAAMTAALLRSAKKFGARIAAHQKFKLGNDPRDRELNNPALLTAINRDYDVVFVADRDLEMARQVSYRTVRARPVVGSIDLEPEAWHWTWERHGGPQLSARFQRKSRGLRMASADWAAWIAVKLVSEAVLRTGSIEAVRLRQHILAPGADGQTASIDGSKSLAVSVRPWDQQLRQPMLLTTPLSVVGTAPIDGFLHQRNRLDSLGDDEGETPCRLNRVP